MRRFVLLISFVVLMDTALYSALTPLLPHYADQFGISRTAAGVLLACYGCGVLVAALPAGVEPFDSGPVEEEGAFSHTFTVKGTYKYACVYHEGMGMVGTVIVT